MLHLLSLLVENHQGVLARISGLFSGRGYNLESITVGTTADPTVSRVTLTCKGDDAVYAQIKKQLNRLIDVVKVVDLSDKPAVTRELALIKIAGKKGEKAEICSIAQAFGAELLDVSQDSITLSLSGTTEKIDDFIAGFTDAQILEIARSGLVAMEKGKK